MKGPCIFLRVISQGARFSMEEMMQKWLMILAMVLFGVSSAGAAQCTAEEKVHMVKRGESLSAIVGVRGVAQAAKRNALGNPNRIVVGQKLCLAQADQNKLIATKTRPDVCGPTDFCWRKEGGKPYAPHRNPAMDDDVLRRHGLSVRQSLELRVLMAQGKCSDVTIRHGDRYEWMAFGNGETRKNVVAAFNSQQGAKRCVLSDGTVLDVPKKCDNIAKPILQQPQIAAVAVPAMSPQQSRAVDRLPTPAECKAHYDAVVGFEHEPSPKTTSVFGSWGAYCLTRGKDYWSGPGVRGLHTAGVGEVLPSGQWESEFGIVGPAYKWIFDSGWDASIGLPMVGYLHERFHNREGYKSERDFLLYGVTADANFYQRELRGEKFMNKLQLSATLTVPFQRDARHWWQGKEIESPADDRLSFMLSAGARGWWTRNIYSQVGIYHAPPVSSSMSIRPIGFADDSQTVGCHAGWDIGLMAHNHDAVFAVGCWVDLVGVPRMLRKDARIAASDRVTSESPNGLVDVTLDEETAAEQVAQTGDDAPQRIDVPLEE